MTVTTPQKQIHLNNNYLQLTCKNEVLSMVANDKILNILISEQFNVDISYWCSYKENGF